MTRFGIRLLVVLSASALYFGCFMYLSSYWVEPISNENVRGLAFAALACALSIPMGVIAGAVDHWL